MSDDLRTDDVRPTPWGDLLVWCTGHDEGNGHTVGFRTEWEHNRWRGTEPEGGWDGMPETITLHRGEYGVNAFVTIADDGTVTGADRTPLMRLHGTNANSWPGPNALATRKFWYGILPALGAWAQTETGKAIMAAGAYAAVHNDLAYVEQALVEAVAKVDALRARAVELEAKRRQLGRAQHATTDALLGLGDDPVA